MDICQNLNRLMVQIQSGERQNNPKHYAVYIDADILKSCRKAVIENDPYYSQTHAVRILQFY